MSAGRGIPANIDAEASLLGCILLRPSVMGEMIDRLDSSDFLKANHRKVFEAIRSLHVVGQPIDVVTVADAAERLFSDGEQVDWIVEVNTLSNATPAISNYQHYANLVIDNSRRRAVIARLAELAQAAYGYENDIDQIIGEATAITGDHLIANRDGTIQGLYSASELVAKVDELEAKMRDEGDHPWLIPGTVKSGWRIIIVAGEGVGKAVLMRFLAGHVAAGRDPWAPERFIQPRRVLYVDAENEEETIVHQMRIANTTDASALIDEGSENYHVWHRDGGIDLRSRRHLAEFEAVLQKTRPEIVFAGPLYKLYRRSPREDMEMAALEFTEILDDLRKRYGFALILEHHAPKPPSGGFRELNPFGSSLFMRWPVLGLTLDFDGPVGHDDRSYRLVVGRFRRDRVIHDWPTALDRNEFSRYAFTGYWPNGRGARLQAMTR